MNILSNFPGSQPVILAAFAVVSAIACWKMRIFRLIAVNFFCAMLLLEGLLALMLACPAFARLGPHYFLTNLYWTHYRTIIQDEPAFARHDPDLKYTLRPGRFTFQNTEFKTEFRVNRIGVRDDETSLQAPDVVVAGDSIPMGWGVKQDETFAQRIEKATGLKVLNAAVSSYSTVEAVRILDRIDTSHLKILILYYEHWKSEENGAFYVMKDRFKTISREKYEWVIRDYQRGKKYWPGKYAYYTLKVLPEALLRRLKAIPLVREPVALRVEADIFLYTLQHASHADLSQVRIVVVCADDFARTLNERRQVRPDDPLLNRISTVVAPEIAGDYAYVLDDHPTALWHEEMASRLLKTIPGIK